METELDYDQLFNEILKFQKENGVFKICFEAVENVNEALSFEIEMEKRDKERNLREAQIQK